METAIASASTNKAPILLVEDSMIMAHMVKNILADIGYTNVATVPNGVVAFEKIQEGKKSGSQYQIVLVDWGVPEMDGMALLKICRKDHDFDKMAIVMLTAVSDRSDMVAALECGANAYITKPFTPEIIAEKIRNVTDWVNKNGA